MYAGSFFSIFHVTPPLAHPSSEYKGKLSLPEWHLPYKAANPDSSTRIIYNKLPVRGEPACLTVERCSAMNLYYVVACAISLSLNNYTALYREYFVHSPHGENHEVFLYPSFSGYCGSLLKSEMAMGP